MNYKVIVFDFDGTLIDSTKLKFEAFYKLFPSDGITEGIVCDVLEKMPEESRYIILENILERMGINSDQIKSNVDRLVQEYNAIVLSGAKRCREMPGTTDILNKTHNKFRLYVSSTTPIDPLLEIIKHKGWLDLFVDIFGYPCDKFSVLKKIIKNENVQPDELLVVGDGQSDELSANEAGCDFFRVENVCSIALLKSQLMEGSVLYE